MGLIDPTKRRCLKNQKTCSVYKSPYDTHCLFCCLYNVYCICMNRLDRNTHNVHNACVSKKGKIIDR